MRGLARFCALALRRRLADSGPWRARLRRRLAGVDRLHAGCGAIRIPGWLNVGLLEAARFPYGALRLDAGAQVLSVDVRRGLPLADASLECVYASHFIEHLSAAEGAGFVAECRRALRPGGRLRLTCPDLELWIRKYSDNDVEFLDSYVRHTRARRGADVPEPHTRAQVLMSQLHGWGHRCGYDAESLCDVLTRGGFSGACRRDHHDSELPDIERLEPSTPARLLETLYVEAVLRD